MDTKLQDLPACASTQHAVTPLTYFRSAAHVLFLQLPPPANYTGSHGDLVPPEDARRPWHGFGDNEHGRGGTHSRDRWSLDGSTYYLDGSTHGKVFIDAGGRGQRSPTVSALRSTSAPIRFIVHTRYNGRFSVESL